MLLSNHSTALTCCWVSERWPRLWCLSPCYYPDRGTSVFAVPAALGSPALPGLLLAIYYPPQLITTMGCVKKRGGVVGQISGGGEEGREDYKGILPTRRKGLSAEEVQRLEVLCAWR